MTGRSSSDLVPELREIRLMINENKAAIRALVRSAERRTSREPSPQPMPSSPVHQWDAEAVRLLRGLLALKADLASEGTAPSEEQT